MSDITTLDEGLKLHADLYLNLLNDDWSDAGLGQFKVGNVPVYSVNPGEATVDDRVSSQRATAGQILDTQSTPGTPSLAFDTDTISKQNMAIAVSAAVEDYTQGSGSLADEAITLVLDRWVPLSKKNLDTGTVVITGTGGTPSLTVRETGETTDTDIEVNIRLGLVMALKSAGAIAVEVDADYSALAGQQVRGGTKTQVRAGLYLDGKNNVQGERFEMDAPNVGLTSSGDIQLMGGDPYATLSFTGKIKTPTGATTGYTLRWLPAEA